MSPDVAARPPLDADRLADARGADGFRVEVVEALPSTNAVVAQRARDGEPEGLVAIELERRKIGFPTVHARADFLSRLGRWEEARVEWERAASLTQNARERTLLLKRAASCADRT